MTLIEYLKAKYPSGNFGMMSLEARVFGIKYPLQNGWLQKHQNDEISAAQIRKLKSLLRKRDKEINKRTLEFLEQKFEDDHIELMSSAISATFPRVDLSIQENTQACSRFLTRQEESNDEIQGFVLTLLRTLHPSHIAELKRQLLQA